MYYMKRRFDEIRKKILKSIKNKPLTKMEISKEINADYRTVERHLIWLLGMGKIKTLKKNKKIYYKLK